MDNNTLFQIIILIISVVIHEVSHGYAALWMGDVTAKYAGRLTLNPIKHLDPLGSVILPALLVLSSSGFVVGWAKPVPYNPYNLRNQRWGELIIAIAGPISNILIAILVGTFVRFSAGFGLSDMFIQLAFITIVINLFLALFNLVPIPPLDGSKILFGLFPGFALKYRPVMERYSLPLLLLFILFLTGFLAPIVLSLSYILIGS